MKRKTLPIRSIFLIGEFMADPCVPHMTRSYYINTSVLIHKKNVLQIKKIQIYVTIIEKKDLKNTRNSIHDRKREKASDFMPGSSDELHPGVTNRSPQKNYISLIFFVLLPPTTKNTEVSFSAGAASGASAFTRIQYCAAGRSRTSSAASSDFTPSVRVCGSTV